MRKIIFLLICIINLFATTVPESEPNNTEQKATLISIYDTGIGNLSSNDNKDWWKFTVPQNGILTVYVLANDLIDSNKFSYDNYKILFDNYGNFYYLYSKTFSVNKNNTYYISLKYITYDKVYYELYFSFKNVSNFHPIFNENLNGELNVIGNHNICYTNNGKKCLNPGNEDNNNVYQNYINVDPNSNYINSSEADLNLKTGDKIVKGYLFWMGRIKRDDSDFYNEIDNANKVEFKTPTTNDYVEIDANSSSFNWYYGSDGVFDYGAYADVTQYVQKSGQYYVANLQVSEGKNTGGGWSLVVVTKNPQNKYKKIVVYQGFQAIYNQENYPHSVTQLLNNFYTPVSGPVNASFILFANETDRDLDDNISLTDKNGNIHYLSNALNPPDNVLNCTISKFGVNVINRNPNFENTLGTDIDEFDVSDIFDNAQTETNITITSKGDRVFLSMFGISIQLYVPKVCYYDFNLYDENDNLIEPNSQLNVNEKIKVKFKIKNDENEMAKNVYLIYPFDENNMTEYIHNSTGVKNVGENEYIHFDDNEKIGNLGVYLNSNALKIGVLGDVNNNFLPYEVNNSYVSGIEFNLTLKKEGNLSFIFYTDYNYILGNKTYSYQGKLPKCSEFNTNYSVYNPPAGYFNVVNENFNGDTDPLDNKDPLNSLYTQIVNKPFDVQILHLGNDKKTLSNYIGLVRVDLIKTPSDLQNIHFNNLNILDTKYVAFDNNDTTNDTFNSEKASKDSVFIIRYLTNGNNNSAVEWNCIQNTKDCIWGMLEKTYDCNGKDKNCPCENECKPGDGTGNNQASDECLECLFNSEKVGYVLSRDNFAIRPDKFKITNIPSKIIAGKEFNLTLKAIDYNGNTVKDYNETVHIQGTSPDLEYNISKKGCDDGNLTGSGEFKNGEANITLQYDEIGELNLTLKEINGSEYAIVDNKDTNNINRLIEENKTQIYIYPHHFEINATLNNFKNQKFSYISNDLNMSSILDLNITAENEQNRTTENYNEQCYAKNFDINISHSVLSNRIQKIIYKEDLNNTKFEVSKNQDINFTNLSKNYFLTDHNGTAVLKIRINFEKNYSIPVSEFNFTIKDINVSDVNGTFGYKNLEQNATFRYGRIHVNEVSGIGKEVNTTFKYEYWDDNKGWVVNTDHNGSIFGDYNKSGSYYPSDINFSTISQNGKNILEGKEKIKFITTHSLPYSAKIHLSIPSWLWYHPLATKYENPSATNTDCRTHPCLKVNFLNSSTGWGGVEAGTTTIKKEFNVSKRTVDINNTNEKNISKKGVKKINW